MTAPTSDEAVAMREVLDKVLGPMPIYGTRIGYRTDSTEGERRLGDFLFRLAREWEDFKLTEAGRKTDAERENINTRGRLSTAKTVATIVKHVRALAADHPVELGTIELAINRADIAGWNAGQRDMRGEA